MNDQKVMIAGIGGASLGTEICKSARLANGYSLYGCNISTTAYELFKPDLTATYRVNRNNYIANVIKTCKRDLVNVLFPVVTNHWFCWSGH